MFISTVLYCTILIFNITYRDKIKPLTPRGLTPSLVQLRSCNTNNDFLWKFEESDCTENFSMILRKTKNIFALLVLIHYFK
jgi:hypothetical protein